MSPEHPHRRRTDRPWLDRMNAAWRSPAVATGMTFVAIALAAFAVWTSQNDASDANATAENAKQIATNNRMVLRAIEREGSQRRDQSCLLFERQANTAVRQLKATYRFLRTLPASEHGSPLVQAIVRQMPQTERNARKDTVAPRYCNAPGVGLPEPPRNLPPRRDFTHLLKKGPGR